MICIRTPLPKSDSGTQAPDDISILYHDEHLIAINKPPGQLAHPAGKVYQGTLLNQLQDWCLENNIDDKHLALINRIDRDTSGIILAGLSKEAVAGVCELIRIHEVHKEYRAICHGCPSEQHGHWRDPIGEPYDNRIGKIIRADGLPSHTEFTIGETTGDTSTDNAFTLLHIRLHTGRQHQIRLHAAHNGFPLVGDWVYGSGCEELAGQALHAAELGFKHPVTKKTFTSPRHYLPHLETFGHNSNRAHRPPNAPCRTVNAAA